MLLEASPAISFQTSRPGGAIHIRTGPSGGHRRPKEAPLKSRDFRAVPYACRCGVFHQELNRKGILSTGGPRRPLQSSNFDASPLFYEGL